MCARAQVVLVPTHCLTPATGRALARSQDSRAPNSFVLSTLMTLWAPLSSTTSRYISYPAFILPLSCPTSIRATWHGRTTTNQPAVDMCIQPSKRTFPLPTRCNGNRGRPWFRTRRRYQLSPFNPNCPLNNNKSLPSHTPLLSARYSNLLLPRNKVFDTPVLPQLNLRFMAGNTRLKWGGSCSHAHSFSADNQRRSSRFITPSATRIISAV